MCRFSISGSLSLVGLQTEEEGAAARNNHFHKTSASTYLRNACNSAFLELLYLAAFHTGLSNVMEHSNCRCVHYILMFCNSQVCACEMRRRLHGLHALNVKLHVALRCPFQSAERQSIVGRHG